jgi:serine/threonine-protein kinase/endoribonuclease IRE1
MDNYFLLILVFEILRYFILELCAASLADYISGKYTGPMPQERDSLIHMANGVQYIHSMNLVHRDIKPENVLISVKDEILLKVSDFGCSKQSRDGVFSMSSRISGTTNYLAPEILEVINSNESPSGRNTTNASDVFALGCTFYMFLTRGTHPFGQGFSIAPNILEGKSNLQSWLTLIQF